MSSRILLRLRLLGTPDTPGVAEYPRRASRRRISPGIGRSPHAANPATASGPHPTARPFPEFSQFLSRTFQLNNASKGSRTTDRREDQTMEKATFAAGCFWGVEAAFQKIKGVVSTSVGYTGGTLKDPTYEQVCGHRTGHAEAVEVVYDPSKVSYQDLLDAFWKIHDPTTLNRQGPDVGSQYRSAIFFHTPEQQTLAKASKEKIQNSQRRPIVTEITPVSEFYRAEEYHQKY